MTHPAADAARRFLDAVIWNEHLTAWELLSPAARSTALMVAERNGLDALVAARARAGTWAPDEADALLGDLVRGLRADLADVELASIAVGDATMEPDGRGSVATVLLSVPSLLPAVLTGGDAWAAGTIELVDTVDGWRVDRLRARRARRS